MSNNFSLNNYSTYLSDNKCYKSIKKNGELTEFINNNFDKYQYVASSINMLNNCENKARELNKDFFLVSDFEVINNMNKYSCLIPKVNHGCHYNGLDKLFKPFNDLLDQLFGSKSLVGRSYEQSINNVFSDQSFNNFSPSYIQNINCFQIEDVSNNKFNYAKKDYYTMYKLNFIDNQEQIDILKSILSYQDYLNQKNQIFVYQNLTQDLVTNMKLFVCNPETNNYLLDATLVSIADKYNEMLLVIENIKNDTNKITDITNYYTLYFDYMDDLIKQKKLELSNLLSLDGANNGKLEDTIKKKNLILSETIIIILIIIFVIFINSNKK